MLVPCDFSPAAQQAFKFAIDIASANDGEVVILHVIDLPFLYESTFGVQPYWRNPALFVDLSKEAKKRFEKLKGMFPDTSARMSFITERGPVKQMILKAAEDHEVDLIIMGTEGSNGLKEILIGSNTERIVRFSSVPVITVRRAPAISSIRNIVFPTTLDPDQDVLIEQVKRLQRLFNATIHVLFLCADEVGDSPSTIVLDAFAKVYHLTNYTLNVQTEDSECEGILAFTKEIHGDLIAMGTYGRHGFVGLLSGSLAEDVAQRAECPAWTLVMPKTSVPAKETDIHFEEDTLHGLEAV